MIFTENSPLVPMFYQATIQAFESGAYDRLSLNWQGGPIKPIGAVDLLILTPGQVFLIFGIMCFFMVTAIFAFFLEWCCHCLKKKYGKKLDILPEKTKKKRAPGEELAYRPYKW